MTFEEDDEEDKELRKISDGFKEQVLRSKKEKRRSFITSNVVLMSTPYIDIILKKQNQNDGDAITHT